jgi:rare lipoprotein A
MRRTIGISLAFLMSAGAIAKTPDNTRPLQPGQPNGKSARAEARDGVGGLLSCQTGHTREHAGRNAPTHSAEADPYTGRSAEGPLDPYVGPVHPIGKGQFGKAAWYGLVGNHTSSGEILDTVTPTAAHRSLPLASYAKVTNLDTGRSVVVKINDRGPYTRGFIIDLSPRAADEIDMRRAGVAAVVVEPVAPGSSAPNAVAYQGNSAPARH